jgi:hypothetical protein
MQLAEAAGQAIGPAPRGSWTFQCVPGNRSTIRGTSVGSCAPWNEITLQLTYLGSIWSPTRGANYLSITYRLYLTKKLYESGDKLGRAA